MANDFRLDLYSPSGVRFAQVNRFLALAFRNEINIAAPLTAVFNANDPVVSQLEDKSHVELYWRDKAVSSTWIKLFGGLYRKQNYEDKDTTLFRLTAFDYKVMLGYRINAFYANVLNRTKFLGVPAETIMKTMVTYNLTSQATTANSRLRDGTNWPSSVISVAADAAGGNSKNWYNAHVTILENLRELSLEGGGDFDLIKTGTNAFEFQFYPGQRGTDKSSSVIFSKEKGNIGDPSYELDLGKEFTAGIVGGQGEDDIRDFVIRTGPNYAADNDIEVFIAATNIDKGDTSGLNDAGDKRLNDLQAMETFAFKILQRKNTQFGIHYELGDLVTVVNPFKGTATTQKVLAVEGNMEPDGTTDLKIEVGTP